MFDTHRTSVESSSIDVSYVCIEQVGAVLREIDK